MNKNVSHHSSKILFTAIFLGIIFNLLSCKNFFNAKDIAKDIQKSIDYANAPACSVLLKAEESQGTFIAGDSKEFKVGYDTEIFFSANIENCILDYLVAQSVTDPDKDMSEYIKIEITERDDEKGFYTIKVKMLKQAPDIIIRPVCIPFPAVKSYSPAKDSEPMYANYGITVTFNMPVESEATTSAQSLFNYNNIYITYNSQDITEYFENPKFNQEKTVLTINPKKTFVDYVKSTNEVSIKINVIFGDSIIIKNESRMLRIKQNENSNFQVSYKPELENTPPEATGFGFFASNKEYLLEELNNKPNTNDLEVFNHDELTVQGNLSIEEYSQKVIQNRTQGSFYIYGRYYDKDSGVNKITISCKHTNSKEGLFLREKEIQTDYFVDKEYDNVIFYKQDKTVLFRIKYTIPETSENQQENDGPYSLIVNVYDTCDNVSQSQKFTAIKDAFWEIESFHIYNISDNFYPNERRVVAVEYINNGTYSSEIKKIKFYYERTIYSFVDGNKYIDLYVNYINKDNQEVTEKIQEDSNNKKFYSHTLDVDYVHDLKITIIAKDINGQELTRDLYFPPVPIKSTFGEFIIIPANSKYTVYHTGTLGTNNEHMHGTSTDIYDSGAKFLMNESGRKQFYLENVRLFSELSSDPLEAVDISKGPFIEDVSLPIPSPLTDVTCSLKDGKFEYIYKFDENIWNENPDAWDFICVYNSLMPFHYPTLIIPNGYTEGIQIRVYTPNLSETYYVEGVKGNKRSKSSAETTIQTSQERKNALEKEKEETNPPYITNSFMYVEQSVGEIPLYDKMCDYFYIPNIQGQFDSFQVTVNNTYRDYYNSDIFGKTNGFVIMDAGSGSYYVPIIDWKYGDNLINVKIENKNGISDASKNMFLARSPIIFTPPEQSTLPVSNISLTSAPTEYDIDTNGYEGGYDYSSHIYVAYMDSDGWHNYGKYGYESNVDPVDAPIYKSGTTGAYTYSFYTDNTIPSDVFIKVSTSLSLGKYSSYIMFFNGNPSSGDLTDKLIDMGDYFYVTSDMPVYINTVTTKCQYSECCNWTSDQWEELHLKYNEKYLPFNKATSNILGIYRPDISWLQTGDCYVIIAHFADGRTKMSEVKVK